MTAGAQMIMMLSICGIKECEVRSARTTPGKLAESAAEREVPLRAFSKSLPMELLRAREAVMRQFRPGLREIGVTEQQWRILRALAHRGPLEATGLAEATCLLAPSISRILPDMEARQLISRRQPDSDLRRSVIRLERKGLRLIAVHAPAVERTYDAITRRFGQERLNQLFGLLLELEDAARLAATEIPVKSRRAKPRSRR
jgi:homoprotocatechuate degradation regulator HpaR